MIPPLRGAVALLGALLLGPGRLAAQLWHRGDSLPLLQRAATHRLSRDADTLLAAWQARAHGVVRMTSVVEHGGTSVERVIRADELEVEVYGEAPNRHKQIIVAWRDSSFLPNRVRYHRDHLGIVANDFGGVLRLGEGEEVRDVLHPLSPAGLLRYQFAERDTLRIAGPGGTVRVVAVDVRPLDPTAPGTVGTLYLDIDRAALVRFRFTFTPASYRDPSVEDITVTLENSLQEGTRWLPWQQSIVIRRGEPILDLPLRTILRADWTLTDYELGVAHVMNRFLGFQVDGLRRPGGDTTWRQSLAERLAPLPDADAAIAEAQRAAMQALGGRLLDGLPHTRLAAGGVSDLLRVTRVSGVTPMLGVRRQLGGVVTLRARLGIGGSDGRVVGGLSVARSVAGAAWTRGMERRLADVGDAPSGSGVVSSLATMVGGADLGDWTLLERVALGVRTPVAGGSLDAEVAREWSWSVAAAFSPITGETRANPALGIGAATIARLELSHRDAASNGWRAGAEAGAGAASWQRFDASWRGGVTLGDGRLGATVDVGAASPGLPGYRAFVLGGRHTLPGIPYRALGGARMARVEIGWTVPATLPMPPLPNARGLRLPSAVTPFLAAGITGGDARDLPWRASGRVETVAGVRLDLWGPLFRVEAGISLRTGRFGVSLDAHPDWWPVM
ncbi:MAG: hypothetical protein KA745_00915 [Gemmatimonadales bacterium]|nr:hypothetical protein [Gemmatimonadales bacterium]